MGAVGRVWLGATGLCFGTLVGSRLEAPEVSLLAIFGGAALLGIRRQPIVSLAALTLLGVGAGMVNAQLRLTAPGPLTDIARQVPRCEVTGRILEPIGSLGLLVLVSNANCDTFSATNAGVAVVRDIVGPPGATFESEGWIVPLGTGPFDVALRRAGAQAGLHATETRILSAPDGMHGLAERVRAGLSEAVTPLDHRVGALIKGLTIGDTSGLDPATVDVFRAAGLSHILAVSGSNVAIVLGAILVAARAAGHQAKIALGYLALGLFTLVVGPDPSVLRAVAMGSIALACLAYGRTAEPLAALGLAIIGVVALRPGMLFSVGMQLSAAATAGIVVFTRRLEGHLVGLPGALRTMFAATLAAQIGVAPILILVFGEMSLIAPVANLLALPAVAPGTVVGLGAGALAVFSPVVGRLLGRSLAPLGAWILLVADRTGGVSWAVMQVPAGVGWLVLILVVGWGVAVLRTDADDAG